MTLSFLPSNAFPLPTPLTSTLVALGLDNKTATAVSRVYTSAALSLKGTFETEYIRACDGFVSTSDDRGYSSKELRSRLLTVLITRYAQALSQLVEGTTEKAQASLLKRRRVVAKPELTIPLSRVPGTQTDPFAVLSDSTHTKNPELSSDWESIPIHKPCPFDTTSPPHAFPRAYPPPVRPGPITFATRIPLVERRPGRERRIAASYDLDACIAAFAQLSLRSPPLNPTASKPSKAVPKPRSRTRNSDLKATSQLSPSSPRLVSPVLDTSVAVSHKPLQKHIPTYPSPVPIPRSRNIDIPYSNRHKVCPVPYRRPTVHPSTSPRSSSFPSSSRTICRTPSLVSDDGSEASSPSTPQDFLSMPIPTPTPLHKGSSPETVFLLDQLFVPHTEWQDIDFGIDVYG